MINGNVSEFIDHICYGDELIFIFQGEKYFLQGSREDDGILTLYLDRWEPPADNYMWVGRGDQQNYPVEAFLSACLWKGKTFWAVEKEIEWVD